MRETTPCTVVAGDFSIFRNNIDPSGKTGVKVDQCGSRAVVGAAALHQLNQPIKGTDFTQDLEGIDAMELVNLEKKFEEAKDAAFRARATSEYRRIRSWVNGRIDFDHARILDFGCGQGIAAASVALRHPKASVVGFDIEPVSVDVLDTILSNQVDTPAPANLSFISGDLQDLAKAQKFDLIYAWSVFEHVAESTMIATFKALKDLLAPGGLIFVQVNPLYFSPRGSHLYKYFPSPWHHLILSLEQLRDGLLTPEFNATASREWRQFMDLNRLTAEDIVGRAKAAGLNRVKFQTWKTDLVPPPRLLRLYAREALETNEFAALFE